MTVSNLLQRKSILTAGLLLLAGASGLFGQVTASSLVVATSNLAFTYQTGTAAPPPQTLRIYSAPAGATYVATVSTTNGIGWLSLGCVTCGTSPISGAITLTGNTGTAGQDLSVSVSPTNLAPSATPYTGSITLSSGGQTLTTINVALTVVSTPTITITPSSVPVQTVEAGRIAQVQVTVNSTAGTTSSQTWQATVENQTPATNWLSLVPTTGGFTGTSTFLNINAGLITGTNLAVASVRFTQIGTNQSVTLPISVQITPAATVQVSSTLVTFPYQIGGLLPSAKQVTVASSTSTVLTYNVTLTGTPNYFTLSQTATPSNATTLSNLTTPGTFFIQPNLSALPANAPVGNYDTLVQVASSSGSSQNIVARIVVTNQNTLTANPEFYTWAYTLGGNDLQPTSISIGSTSAPLAFTVAPVFEPTAPNFFTVTANTPFSGNTVQVTPNRQVISGLPAGTYSGKVRVTPANGSTVLDIPINLVVSGSAQLTVEVPDTTPFQGNVGAGQNARTMIVRSSTATQLNFNVAVNYGTGPSGWLSVSPLSGTTGTNSAVLSYNINPDPIKSAGTYTANIVVTPVGIADPVPFTVVVQYNVAGAIVITPSKTTVELTQTGTTAPPTQSIQITSGGSNITYQPVVNASGTDPVFVRIAPTTTTTVPGVLDLAFDSSTLPARPNQPYENTVTLIPNQASVARVVITVRLTVTTPVSLVATPASVAFTFTTGGTNPAPQTITVNDRGTVVPFTATTTTEQGNWLSASAGTGVITVSANPAGLSQGTYRGTITATPTSGGTALTIPVTLTVTTPNPPNSLQVSNNASGISRGVSPGGFITIKGSNMAPSTATVFTTVPAPTTLGEVRVLFDGVPAPVLYVGPSGDRTSDQINAIVPYGISGRTTTNVVVEYRGVQSTPVPLTVRDTEPGIFTANSAGSGPASMLNQDNSFNTQANPAILGNVVQIFGTGAGLIAPNPGDGRVVPSSGNLPVFLNSPVQVRIGGRVAQLQYAGPAPGLLAGVFQINAVVPTDLVAPASTQTSLEVQIGTTSSQPGVTFWVRGQQ